MNLPQDLEHKKLLLEKITGAYQSDGPLPPLRDLNSFIIRMDPKELAEAIYLLESHRCRRTLPDLSPNQNEDFKDRVDSSKGVKDNIEKIFMAVAEHFRRGPGEASEMVDQIFHYFYKALVHLVTDQGFTSHN
jgi:hypothetical protein